MKRFINHLIASYGVFALFLLAAVIARGIFGGVFHQDEPETVTFYQTAATHILTTGRLDYTASIYNVVTPDGVILRIATPFDRPPVYPVLLAASTRIFASFEAGTQALQGALWLLLLVFTFVLIEVIFQRRVLAFFAALLVGVYPYYLSNSFVQSDHLIVSVFFLGLMFAALKLITTAKPGYAILFGVLVGLEILTRGLSMLLTPLVLAYLFFVMKPRKALVFTGLILGSIGVLLAPWMMYTYAVYGQPVIVTGMGLRFWEGNNPYLSECGYPVISIDRCNLSGEALSTFPDDAPERMLAMSPVELDRYLLQTGIEYTLRNPALMVARTLIKLNAAWSPLYNPTYTTAGMHVSRSKAIIYTVSYGFMLAFGLPGMVMAWRKARHAVVLSGFVFIAFSVYSAVLWAHTVHKLFLTVFLILFAAHGLMWCIEYVLSRIRRGYIQVKSA